LRSSETGVVRGEDSGGGDPATKVGRSFRTRILPFNLSIGQRIHRSRKEQVEIWHPEKRRVEFELRQATVPIQLLAVPTVGT
jgi:hypothetical protein